MSCHCSDVAVSQVFRTLFSSGTNLDDGEANEVAGKSAMKAEQSNVCLLIDRRSTLALFLLFVISNSTEINYAIAGAAGTALSCYFLSVSAARLEEQLQDMKRASLALQMEMATAQQEIHVLQGLALFPFDDDHVGGNECLTMAYQ